MHGAQHTWRVSQKPNRLRHLPHHQAAFEEGSQQTGVPPMSVLNHVAREWLRNNSVTSTGHIEARALVRLLSPCPRDVTRRWQTRRICGGSVRSLPGHSELPGLGKQLTKSPTPSVPCSQGQMSEQSVCDQGPGYATVTDKPAACPTLERRRMISSHALLSS